MDKHTHNSSSRRRFMEKAALTSVAWVPFLQAQRSLGNVGSRTSGSSPLGDRKDEIRIGLIGLTGRPGIVLNAISNIPGARLVAFALTDGDWLPKTRSRKHDQVLRASSRLPSFRKDTNLYETYQEMFAYEDLDIVASCLPNGLNVYASTAAARKGCHVISEEPLALGSESLAALESVVDGAKVHISAMCEMRACPGVAAMRKAIAGGLIGEPILAFAQKSCKQKEEQSLLQEHAKPLAGATPWMGLDLLDCISYTTGLEITQASALQSNKDHAVSGFHQNPGLLVKLLNGGTGIVSVHYVASMGGAEEGSARLRVTGTKGVIEMIGAQVQLFTPNHAPKEMPLPPRRSSFESFATFLRGQGTHLMTTGETFRMARAALMADQAVKEGRVVRA
jgi:myo-inositol 2-dehydrogenase / D-chiro-inositol 1-dehydrogenase